MEENVDTETQEIVSVNYREIIKNTIIIGIVSLIIGLIFLILLFGGLKLFLDLFNQYPYSTLGQNSIIVVILSLLFALFIFFYALALIGYFFLNVYAFVYLYNPIVSKYLK